MSELHRHPLAALRARSGWSATEYLRRLDGRHRELGFGAMAIRREKVARWESGGTTPDETAQLAMADLHGIDADIVRRLGWPQWLLRAFPADATVVEAPWTAVAVIIALTTTVRSIDTDRRAFPIVGGRALAWLARAWRRASPDALVGQRTDHPLLARELPAALDERLRDLRHLCGRIADEQLRDLAGGDLGRLERFVTSTSFDASTGQVLLRLVAGTAAVAGWASSRGGRVAAAQTAYLTALRATAAAGDTVGGRRLFRLLADQATGSHLDPKERPSDLSA